MNLKMGSQVFINVEIPLLWGDRAILQDRKSRISIVNLSGDRACLEVLGDEPAPGVGYLPRLDGIAILQDGVEQYLYDPEEKTISSLSLGLPEIQIANSGTRIGINWLYGIVVADRGVGIAVTKDGVTIGAQLPANLAKLQPPFTPPATSHEIWPPAAPPA